MTSKLFVFILGFGCLAGSTPNAPQSTFPYRLSPPFASVSSSTATRTIDRMDKKSLAEFQSNHVAAWNEKDAFKRETLLRKVYADDIKMYDEQMILSGLKQVSDFIGKLIADDPKYTFSPLKPIEGVQTSIRLFGQIQTGKGMLYSMDFFVLEKGKATHLYVYMSPVAP